MSPEQSLTISRSVDQLIAAYQQNAEGVAFDISHLKLRIRLEGPKWAGLVDKPVAKFLLDLDRKIIDYLQHAGVELPQVDHGLIALRIQEGSMDALFEYSKDFLSQIRKMKPREQILLFLGILAALGIWQGPDIIEKLQADDLAEIEKAKQTELLEQVAVIVENTRELQQPMRGLVNSMGDSDEITMPGTAAPVKKEAVKERLVKGSRSPVSTFYVDHRYIVQDLSTRKPGEWQIGLVYGGVAFKAKLLITDEEIDVLLKEFQEAHARHSEIAPDLQVNAEINAKGVRAAQVIGLGAPRPRSISLGEAISKATERESKDSTGDE